MDYVPYAVPFFLIAILIELAYGIVKKKNTYRLNDAISSLFMGTLRTANKLIIISLGGYVFYLIETNNSLWRMDASSPWYGSLRLWCTTLFITGFTESVMKDKYFGRLMWLIIKAKITT